MGSVKARIEDEMETPKVGLHSHSWVGGPFPGKKPRPTDVLSPPAKLQPKFGHRHGHVIEDLVAFMHWHFTGCPTPASPTPCLPVPKPFLTHLCRTVDPAARAATALLGERPEEPTLVPLGVGPGCGERGDTGGWMGEGTLRPRPGRVKGRKEATRSPAI